jgi:hypothetical protein
MSGSDSKWGELSSQHERFVERESARSQWAELASQRERLLDESDPLYRLASSSHPIPGMRLVSTAA